VALPLSIASGGTSATTAAGALTALGALPLSGGTVASLGVSGVATFYGNISISTAYVGYTVAPAVDGAASLGTPDLAYSGVYSYSMIQASDPRLKQDVAPVPRALEKIRAVPVKHFRWRKDADGPLHTGFDASDVRTEVAEAVVAGEDERLGLDLTAMLATLWRAVQELADKIDALESRR